VIYAFKENGIFVCVTFRERGVSCAELKYLLCIIYNMCVWGGEGE